MKKIEFGNWKTKKIDNEYVIYDGYIDCDEDPYEIIKKRVSDCIGLKYEYMADEKNLSCAINDKEFESKKIIFIMNDNVNGKHIGAYVTKTQFNRTVHFMIFIVHADEKDNSKHNNVIPDQLTNRYFIKHEDKWKELSHAETCVDIHKGFNLSSNFGNKLVLVLDDHQSCDGTKYIEFETRQKLSDFCTNICMHHKDKTVKLKNFRCVVGGICADRKVSKIIESGELNKLKYIGFYDFSDIEDKKYKLFDIKINFLK